MRQGGDFVDEFGKPCIKCIKLKTVLTKVKQYTEYNQC